ncbi:MAG: Dabb family protein [Cyclobacteriaceae bacterium]
MKKAQLRHVVMFKFKEDASQEGIEKVEKAFADLQNKIPQIKDFEWGTNNSPEGLDKGFTHCFFVTFDSEEDRAAYLPHPDHKAFVEVLKPVMEDAMVLDYWAK